MTPRSPRTKTPGARKGSGGVISGTPVRDTAGHRSGGETAEKAPSEGDLRNARSGGTGSLRALSLGEPDRHDVDSAARLYLAYDRAGLLSEEVCEMFAMMVEDYPAVYARAVEMKREGNGGK